MTLAAAVPVSSYIGTGGANTYPFNFPVFSQSDLVVTVTNTSSPATTYLLVLGTDYSVSGLNAAGSPSSTGSIVLVGNSQAWMTGSFLTSGFTLAISRVVSIAQNSSIRNQGDFYQEYIENALDYITMILQQIQAQLPVTTTVAPPTGFTLADTVNGHTYQILMVNGQISSQQIT